MTSLPRHHHSFRDYLDLEEASNVKHEFCDGEIYAMAGGTPEHAALAVAVSSALHAQLVGKPYRVFSSDLRVRVLSTGLTTYPDVTVIYGPLERDLDSPTTVVNPTLVVEVLSEATEDCDRGEKLVHYKQIPSLKEIMLVSQTEPRLEVFRRTSVGWTHHVSQAGQVELTSIACVLDVALIFAASREPDAAP